MSEPVRVLVASPYREGSTMAVTRVAHRRARLARYVTNVGFGDPPLGGRAVPAMASGLVAQKVLRDIPSDAVSHVGVASEVAHLLMRRVPGGGAFASRRMYAAKRAFDAQVARRLEGLRDESGAGVVLGLYGSSSRTFEEARRLGLRSVLNFVNSEPRTQNALLAEFAGLPPDHHEMIADGLAVEVGHEIDVADLILVPSAFVRDQLVGRGVEERRIALVRYGVDLSAFRSASVRPAPAAGAPLRALFLGQVAYRKGIPTLLEAMKGLGGEVDLELRGPVTSPQLLDDLPPGCTYAGTSSHQEVPAALARADVLVLPSYEDAYPLVVLEAMAAGVAVVVSTNVGSSEVITDGENGLLVAPGDVEGLRTRLSALHHDRELVRRLGAAARESAVTTDWDDYGAEVLRAIDALGART